MRQSVLSVRVYKPPLSTFRMLNPSHIIILILIFFLSLACLFLYICFSISFTEWQIALLNFEHSESLASFTFAQLDRALDQSIRLWLVLVLNFPQWLRQNTFKALVGLARLRHQALTQLFGDALTGAKGQPPPWDHLWDHGGHSIEPGIFVDRGLG